MNSTSRSATSVLAALILLAGCGGDDTNSEAAARTDAPAPGTTAPATPRTTLSPAATTPSAVEPEEALPTTAPSTDSAPDPAAETTSPACDRSCPPDAETMQRIKGFIEAYNAGDWDAWIELLVDDEPTWQTPLGPQNTALVRFDFEWSAALGEVWELGECIERRVDISCEVTIEDDVHRALAYRDLEPSACRFSVTVDDDGLVDPVSYDIVPCHEGYDSVFHVLGGWFDEQYPDEPPVQGAHYRAWNQPMPDRAVRVVEVLPEFVAHLDEVGASLGGGHDD